MVAATNLRRCVFPHSSHSSERCDPEIAGHLIGENHLLTFHFQTLLPTVFRLHHPWRWVHEPTDAGDAAWGLNGNKSRFLVTLIPVFHNTSSERQETQYVNTLTTGGPENPPTDTSASDNVTTLKETSAMKDLRVQNARNELVLHEVLSDI